MTHPSPNSSALTAQTIACLAFFERWETPYDLEAAKLYSRVRLAAPDFASFQRFAPPGSPERALFERFLGPFEEAGRLIREGKMRADLFFDSWYELPLAWHRCEPYVAGMRAERNDPQLYRDFEWLAQEAARFWQEREAHPLVPHPLDHEQPTGEDRAIFETFNRHSFLAPDHAAWSDFAMLQQQAPTFAAFSLLAPRGSQAFSQFDEVMCMYDRAGGFVKNGIIHPALVLTTWRSPEEVWRIAQPWVEGLREEEQSAHPYEHAEWLAAFEASWRQDHSA